MNATKIQRLVGKDFDKQKARARARSKKTTSTSPDRRLTLASTIGNRGFGRLLQAKLTIGAPNDKYEQEADRVADAVMRMPEPDTLEAGEQEEDEELRTKPLASQITPLVQRVPDEMVEEQEQEDEDLGEDETAQAKLEDSEVVQREEDDSSLLDDEKEEGKVRRGPSYAQAKSTDGQALNVPKSVESNIQALRGRGQPLPASERAFFEPRFGRDFSGVRVHTDSRAHDIARLINARAFTVGRDIVFGDGQYSPGISYGRRLISHELTHVIQQSGSRYTTINAFQTYNVSNLFENDFGHETEYMGEDNSIKTKPKYISDAEADNKRPCSSPVSETNVHLDNSGFIRRPYADVTSPGEIWIWNYGTIKHDISITPVNEVNKSVFGLPPKWVEIVDVTHPKEENFVPPIEINDNTTMQKVKVIKCPVKP